MQSRLTPQQVSHGLPSQASETPQMRYYDLPRQLAPVLPQRVYQPILMHKAILHLHTPHWSCIFLVVIPQCQNRVIFILQHSIEELIKEAMHMELKGSF